MGNRGLAGWHSRAWADANTSLMPYQMLPPCNARSSNPVIQQLCFAAGQQTAASLIHPGAHLLYIQTYGSFYVHVQQEKSTVKSMHDHISRMACAPIHASCFADSHTAGGPHLCDPAHNALPRFTYLRPKSESRHIVDSLMPCQGPLASIRATKYACV